jgi:hypothetical protein
MHLTDNQYDTAILIFSDIADKQEIRKYQGIVKLFSGTKK